jgi:hypothetical protein
VFVCDRYYDSTGTSVGLLLPVGDACVPHGKATQHFSRIVLRSMYYM